MESVRETHKRIIAQRIEAVLADAARMKLVVAFAQVPQADGARSTAVMVLDAPEHPPA